MIKFSIEYCDAKHKAIIYWNTYYNKRKSEKQKKNHNTHQILKKLQYKIECTPIINISNTFCHSVLLYWKEVKIKKMNKSCARCSKTVYPIEELKCLDKVSLFKYLHLFTFALRTEGWWHLYCEIFEGFKQRCNVEFSEK